jgi:hypothetical protein
LKQGRNRQARCAGYVLVAAALLCVSSSRALPPEGWPNHSPFEPEATVKPRAMPATEPAPRETFHPVTLRPTIAPAAAPGPAPVPVRWSPTSADAWAQERAQEANLAPLWSNVEAASIAGADLFAGGLPVRRPTTAAPFAQFQAAHQDQVRRVRDAASAERTALAAFVAAERRLDAAAATDGAPGSLDHILLATAISIRRRVDVPLHTTLGDGATSPFCRGDLIVDGTVTSYLEAMSHSDSRTAANALADVDRQLQCVSLRAARSLDGAIAGALASIDSQPLAMRRAVRGRMLPLVVLVADATKIGGPSALGGEIRSHLSEYAAGFRDPSGIPNVFGIWLNGGTGAKLVRVTRFCETGIARGCVSGQGVLAGLTNPVNVGLGDCPLLSMVSGGFRSGIGYSCPDAMCEAARAPVSAPGVTPRLLTARASRAGATPFGASLASLKGPEGSSWCAPGMGARAPGGPGAGANAGAGIGAGMTADASPTLSCVVDELQGQRSKALACAARPSLIAKLSQPPQGSSVPFSNPSCLRSDGQPDTTGSDQLPAAAVNTAVKDVATYLRDPANQQALYAALQSLGYNVSLSDVQNAMNAAADAMTSITTAPNVVVAFDGALTTVTNATGTGVRAESYNPSTNTITVDGDWAAGASEDQITQSLAHEALHEVLSNLASSPSIPMTEAGQQRIMAQSGLAPLTVPKAQDCGPDQDACDTTCTAQDEYIRTVAGCLVSATLASPFASPVTGTVDPSPLGNSAPVRAVAAAACFDGAASPTLGYQCLAIDCPDGATPKNDGGRCTCSGSVAQGGGAPNFGSPGCGALDCANGQPMSGPEGCTCGAPTGFTPSVPVGRSLVNPGATPQLLPRVPSAPLSERFRTVP